MVKNGKKASILEHDASTPRRRFVHLGEPKAPKFPVFGLPQGRLIRLGLGPCLGEGPLRLGELAVLFLFPFFC